MKKRTFMLAMTAACLSFAFIGCGSDKDKESKKDNTEETKEDSQKDDKEDEIPVKDLSNATVDEAWAYADEIVAEIQAKEPTFGDYQVSIADFGATVKDAEVDKTEERQLAIDNTKAIYEAIKDVNSKEKGGTVNVPAGIWYTGPIHLLSNVNLHLEEGAILRFATDTDLYAGDLTKELYGSELTFVRSEGTECYNYSPFIYAKDADNVALTGQGTLDGQAGGEYWITWKNKGEPESNNVLRKMGMEGVDVEERQFGEASGEPGEATDGYIRPNFVVFMNCDQVLIEGLELINTPAWQVHPVYCNYVTVRNMSLNCPTTPNSDGVDPDSCKYVLIEGNTFNTGDDCIAIKSGRNEDARRVGIACENIVVQNNTMEIGHGAVTLGSEASAGIRNVFARNNTMNHTAEEVIFRFKNSTIRGNVLENIYYKDNTVTAFKSSKDMIVFESDYGVESETESYNAQGVKFESLDPITRNVYIDNLNCTEDVKCTVAIRMEGVKDCPIENIHFSNMTFGQVNQFMKLSYVDGLTLENCTIEKNKEADTFEGCKNFTFKNVTFKEPKKGITNDYSTIENFTEENIVYGSGE